MNETSNYLTAINDLLVHPTGGVVGLVDELLKMCWKHRLQLDWQPESYRLRSTSGAWQELSSRPLRSSIFRDMLARVAALCNERAPSSVSPYGGKGLLSVASNPEAEFRVDFVNTAGEQRLQLAPAQGSKTKDSNGTASRIDSEPIQSLPEKQPG